MKLSVIAFRNISRNRKRSILSLTAIAVAAMSITMLFSVLEGIKTDVKKNVYTWTSGQIRIRNIDFDRFEQLSPLHLGIDNAGMLARKLLELDETESVSPRISFPGSVFIDEDRHSVSGIGVDLSFEKNYINFDNILAEGRLPEPGKNEAVIGYRLADTLELKTGDSITILAGTRTRGSNAFTLKITGLLAIPVEMMNNRIVLMPLDRAQNFLWMGETATEILIKLKHGVSDEEGMSAVENLLARSSSNSIRATSWKNIGVSASLFNYMDTVYSFIALFFFILGSTVIINTTMMTVYERIREIGTLGALGMEGRSLVRLFFLEAFFIGLAGSLAGVAAGIAIVTPLSAIGINYGEAMEGIDMGLSTILYPVLNLKSTLFVFLYSLAVASITSLIPSRKASSIEPMEALRSV